MQLVDATVKRWLCEPQVVRVTPEWGERCRVEITVSRAQMAPEDYRWHSNEIRTLN